MRICGKDEETVRGFVKKIMDQCLEVRERHEHKSPNEYNDDTVFRGLVSEMLDTSKFALAKMDFLLTSYRWINGVFYDDGSLSKPLQLVFREHMGKLEREQRASPTIEKAVYLCKQYGLLVNDVRETNTNELGETPLMRACADGVTDDKVDLLVQAGSDVNISMDLEGNSRDESRKGMTPLLSADEPLQCQHWSPMEHMSLM